MNLPAFLPRKPDNSDTWSQGLSDVHCHCGDFSETEAMLHRAKERGIRRILLTGTKPADFGAVRQFGQTSPIETRTAFGIHPWEAVHLAEETEEKNLSLLDSYWKADTKGHRVGIGEIGLDYALRNLDAEQKNRQKRWFGLQLDRAAQTGQPVVIHAVGAIGTVVSHLEKKGPFRLILIHQFRADPVFVDRLVQIGAYFSFHLPVANMIPPKLAETIRAVPKERLLLESDWPGGEIEPRNISLNIMRLAVLRERRMDTITSLLKKNAERFFTVWDKS